MHRWSAAEISSVIRSSSRPVISSAFAVKTIIAENWFITAGPKRYLAFSAALVTDSVMHFRSFPEISSAAWSTPSIKIIHT
jgi:hypothetical protein